MTSSETTQELDTESIVNILIATDNHLGYCEKDPIRGDDSFIAFEEILRLAVEKDVDFILLGGDLFHDPVPSQNALHRCMKLLRMYTMGDRPISIEFLSDQSLAFHDALNQSVNYEDPNLNIAIPVFSIHGNHDDPSGFGRLSSLNLLATTGLINYFGRWTDLENIQINPILLRKGDTQIAMYGLSHIHDNRLIRLFQTSKVVMHQPDKTSGEWFNIMVLHQNRADRGLKNYIPEEVLPEFLDLVMWGHEHDCRIEAEENVKKNFYVTQPGSSVATSLADGEGLPKHVAVLQVRRKSFKIHPLPLQTVRPFIFESITLSDYADEYGLNDADAAEKVQDLARQKVEEMIARADQRLTGHPDQPKLPLIRLRIVYNDESQMFNGIRFGQQYNQRIANAADVIRFKKLIRRTKQEGKPFDRDAMNSAFNEEGDNESRVEDVVDRYFADVEDSKKLQAMTPKVLSEMCFRMVEKNDVNAAENIISLYKEKALEHFMEKLPSEENFDEELKEFQSKGAQTYESILKMLDKQGEPKKIKDDDLDSLFNVSSNKPAPKKTTARQKAKPVDEPMDDAPTQVFPATGRGRGRGAGRARGRGAAASTTGRKMAQLDISVGSKTRATTAAKQPTTLLDAFKQRPSRTRQSSVIVDISSDSD